MKLSPTISAVVTGGASGLGLATVKALRSAGVRVAIFDRNPEAGTAAAAATGALFCEANVLSDDSLDAAFAKARAANGQERALVACAGGGNNQATIYRDQETGALKPSSTAAFSQILALNTVGTFACITRFAAGAGALEPVEGERGVIICTASVAAQDGQETQASYAAAKAAIVGMTLPIARDLAHYGIRINTILPGPYNTPLLTAHTTQEMQDAFCATLTFPRRLGDPSEYASFALELIRNGYFNAASIRLDAGNRCAAR